MKKNFNKPDSPPTKEDKRWLTVRQVMAHEGIGSIHAVYRAINNNRIVAKDYHTLWLIDTAHDSYKEWAEGIREYQNSPQIQGIKEYWRRRKADVNRT